MVSFKKKIALLLIFIGLISVIIPRQVEAATPTPKPKESNDIKINVTKKTLYVGQTYTLKIAGTTQKIMWKSNKASVATVNKSGKVTAIGEGQATITATIGSGSNNAKLTCKITVKQRLSSDKLIVNCPLDEYQELLITFNGAKKGEGIAYIIDDRKVIEAEFGEMSEKVIPIYIEPLNKGTTKITVLTTSQIEEKFTEYKEVAPGVKVPILSIALPNTKINYDEAIDIIIHVGISDDEKWINTSDLTDIFNLSVISSDSFTNIYKKPAKTSLTGTVNPEDKCSLSKPKNAESEKTYEADGVRYKYDEKGILLINIDDLRTKGIIE